VGEGLAVRRVPGEQGRDAGMVGTAVQWQPAHAGLQGVLFGASEESTIPRRRWQRARDGGKNRARRQPLDSTAIRARLPPAHPAAVVDPFAATITPTPYGHSHAMNSRQAPDPAAFFMNTIMGFWLGPTLWVTVRLQLAERVAAGPRTAAVLAAEAGVDRDHL